MSLNDIGIKWKEVFRSKDIQKYFWNVLDFFGSGESKNSNFIFDGFKIHFHCPWKTTVHWRLLRKLIKTGGISGSKQLSKRDFLSREERNIFKDLKKKKDKKAFFLILWLQSSIHRSEKTWSLNYPLSFQEKDFYQISFWFRGNPKQQQKTGMENW